MSKERFHNFDHTLQEAHSWLNEVAENMGNPNRQLAYHVDDWSATGKSEFPLRYGHKDPSERSDKALKLL